MPPAVPDSGWVSSAAVLSGLAGWGVGDGHTDVCAVPAARGCDARPAVSGRSIKAANTVVRAAIVSVDGQGRWTTRVMKAAWCATEASKENGAYGPKVVKMRPMTEMPRARPVAWKVSKMPAAIPKASSAAPAGAMVVMRCAATRYPCRASTSHHIRAGRLALEPSRDIPSSPVAKSSASPREPVTGTCRCCPLQRKVKKTDCPGFQQDRSAVKTFRSTWRPGNDLRRSVSFAVLPT